jgi:hypothetical protein
VKFKDCLFVSRESRILNEPIFGNISDKPSSSSGQSGKKARNKGTSKKSKAAFATSVKDPQKTSKVKDTSIRDSTGMVQSSGYSVKGTHGCGFCSGDHRLETCKQFRMKPHEERLDFLKSKALCFGCLQKAGHSCLFTNFTYCSLC